MTENTVKYGIDARDELAELQRAWAEAEATRVWSYLDPHAQQAAIARQAVIETAIAALPAPPAAAFHEDSVLPDPQVTPELVPLAARQQLRFIIIGAGVSGLCMAMRLLRAGFENVEILEKAEELGGVWHHNRYPGLACDVPAHFYSYSFFRNPNWSGIFAPGAEIKQYLKRFAERFGVADHISFSTSVVSARRDHREWSVETADGTTRKADFLILANGFLHVPRVPDVPGLKEFSGKWMHSSEVGDGYDFKGKRVGNIGTGSTTVQIVSSIVDEVEQLTIFQRTPQWIFPIPQQQYSAARRDMLARYPEMTAGLYKMFMHRAYNGVGDAAVNPKSPAHATIGAACRANLDTVVDPVLRAKLTPDYLPMCKRLVYSNTFYAAVQKPNCTLVTDAIERIESEGVRTHDGTLHKLDTLIFATGYDVGAFGRAFAVVNESGFSLQQSWADGVRSLNSVAVSGFPNMFMLSGAHATVGNFSIAACAEQQSGHIVRLIAEAARVPGATIDAKLEAEERFIGEMNAALGNTVWVNGGCNSWYLNAQGGVDIWTQSINIFADRMTGPLDLSEYELA